MAQPRGAQQDVTRQRRAAQVDGNQVELVGRLAAGATQRELPSGSMCSTWRLVVRRDPDGARDGGTARRQSVDTIDCVAWQPAVQAKVGTFVPGDVVAVSGALRRRFWQGAGGLASRYEVEATSARRVRRAPA